MDSQRGYPPSCFLQNEAADKIEEQLLERTDVICRLDDTTQRLARSSSRNDDHRMELLINFVSSLMARDYHEALSLCKRIIDCEPGNTIARDFLPLLLRKCNDDENSESSGSSGSDSGSSRCSDVSITSSGDGSDTSSCNDSEGSSCFSSDETTSGSEISLAAI